MFFFWTKPKTHPKPQTLTSVSRVKESEREREREREPQSKTPLKREIRMRGGTEEEARQGEREGGKEGD